MQAMKKIVADKHKVEDDYKEASGNLLTATRKITEVEETLKVSQEVLKILVRRPGDQGLPACINGPGCSWLANNRCKFLHEPRSVNSATTPQVLNVNSAVSAQSASTSSNNTVENCMRAIMDRLDELEKRMPTTRNLTNFPPVEEAKKSQ